MARMWAPGWGLDRGLNMGKAHAEERHSEASVPRIFTAILFLDSFTTSPLKFVFAVLSASKALSSPFPPRSSG